MTITELQQYVDTQDNSLRFEFQRMYEDFTHEVTHILNDYEDYLTGRIGSIHEEVWEGVDSILSTTSTAPVQNKVITNALNEKAALSHTHDNRYYTETEINNLLNSKVNIEEGKGLSANNYTDTDKATVAQARNLILNSGSPVTGVKGDAEPSYRVGDINITKANIGLNNVDNTSDVDKPISTAVQTALNNKVDKVSGKGLSTNDFTNAYKQQLDTLDSTYSIQLDEILSTGSQNPVKNRTITNALNLKAPLSSPAFTGIPTAPTATVGTNTTQIATTAFVQTAITNNAITIDIDNALSNNSSNPVENQVITAALNAKAPLNNAALTGTPTAPTAAAGTNTTQIATTGFVNAAISPKIESFEIQYQVTDPNNIYTAYVNHKFIYCFYQNRYYTLQYCSRVSLNIIIRLAAIESNHIYFIDISRIYDNNNEYYDETWNSSNILLIDANTPTVYGYPSYSGFSVSTPDPVSDGQFVTKRYVDSRIAQTEAAIPVTTYRTGDFNLNQNNDAWFNAITQGSTVILDITMYQLGLATTEENDYIHLINSKVDSYTFTGSIFDTNEYYPIACTLTYRTASNNYYWDLKVKNLVDENNLINTINSSFTKTLIPNNTHSISINKTVSDINYDENNDMLLNSLLFTTTNNLTGSIRGNITISGFKEDLINNTQNPLTIIWQIYENQTSNVIQSGSWSDNNGTYTTTRTIEIPISGNNKEYGMILIIPNADTDFANHGSMTFNSISYDVQVTAPWSVQVSN